MAVTGVANLAVKVPDLDPAIEFYERAGAEVRDRGPWNDGERVDVHLGALHITLFTRAIYEPEVAVGDEGFLHVATFSDDLDAEVEGHDVVWGPEVVSGVFGTRRIVFVDAPGDMRIEFMEQLAPAPHEDVDAPQGSLVAELAAFGAATVGESGAAAMSPRIGAMWPGAAVCGPAFPVHCGAGDNLALHAALAEAPAGSVLCVGFDGDDERGNWGEVLTTGALARGIAGLVIDGGVRDVEAIERLGFGVFATGAVLRGASKHVPGSIGMEAAVGGVVVRAGDWVVGDRDGVAVVPVDRLDAVREAAAARTAKEAEMFTALRAGSTTVDLLALDTSGVSRPR